MLHLFPTNNNVRIYSSGTADRWGVTNEDTKGTNYPCIQSFNTKLEKIPVADGKEVVFTASFYFPEEIRVKVDDLVEFKDDLGNTRKKKVMQVQFKRDFAGQVLAVKVVV